MPSASNNNIPTSLPKTMREYEVLVIPSSPTSPTGQYHQPQPQQPMLRTKRINCNQTNGTIFWIPDGYRPVLVRTSDLPLLVGAEYNLPSPSNSTGYTSSDDSNY
ncbi:hypothetical protein RhiirA5_368165 [Rhizophagus irregularis]|uniref:Uncharacterized protein n=2 Tax=Rhizophagus irregularis TaxID=588596 RepID=U9TP17_RHIID|nr:hypothetical protein GLOIN_2v1872703 [Rhizophagus irregularis DAOM 181602=DAOM 197198]PKB94685.1 hypothetical protein RhiirA5_368165 [Rhizophagus irregularis]PKC53236.1 hypothetical protein RhiirA1_430132 [Rhizophagus irregularis]PKK66243.1 hypothetical protein RhiirC2_753757 [Rhizophagus irregularis]PKY29627.1 hypothetical protein RhiirB3_418145 [Rhizophagus irregularis]POG75545.1 hypothetical protein GLOIN_2v1872703 [Rhizophagus irregularis DAOM 181602=DAOM 197198]|eukprot:XP_025182411.1 hypothetical protein GLOIN_2v1872703 [Rhizophagus irregularis DAOM 181602=DAOM 197198]